MTARWCEQGNLPLIWQDVNDVKEQGRRRYARHHYVSHLYFAREWQGLFTILDQGHYGRAKERYDVSTRSYVQDLDRGRQAAANCGETAEEQIRMLPHVWRYTLLRSSLRSLADDYPEETFQLLLHLGREAQVLGLAELLNKSVHKVEILLLLAQHTTKRPEQYTESAQLFFRAREVALSIDVPDEKAAALSSLASSLAQAQL